MNRVCPTQVGDFRSAGVSRSGSNLGKLSVLFLSILGALAVSGCSSDGDSAESDDIQPTVNSLEFSPISYPASDEDKRRVNASSSVEVNGKSYSIGFNTVLRSGQASGMGVFGQLFDSQGKPLKETDGSARISDDNDHSTLLDVYGKVFMVSQFESRPGGFYITELKQEASTGKLTPQATKPINFAAVGGGWVHCAGSRSPWKTHLGSEEYEPDARMIDPATGIKSLANGNQPDTYYGAMADYFGGDIKKVNPYAYGFTIEASVTGAEMGAGAFASNVKVEKHYAMGRVAQELTYVMPDERTAYITDDGAMVGLFMYKADVAQQLSSGTLYAAKLNQTSSENGGSFNVSWVNLGHATDAEIKKLIDLGVTFDDFFTAQTPVADPNGLLSCPAGFVGVSKGHDKTVGNSFNECLALKTSNAKNMTPVEIEKAASRLETRRYAALKGATTELNKEEGITFDPVNKKLYLAMSDITNGMKDNTSGAKSTTEAFSGNQVRLPENRCGGVYELEVNSNFEATSMKGLVLGIAKKYDATSPYASNTCDVDGLANPDNLTFMPGYHTLIIGEDTGTGHQTDLIWSFDVKTKKLTRIQSTPYGSETTSPYFYPNINGWGYLMSVVQHPYGESDTSKVDSGSAERRAYTGYIGPFPKME